MVTILFLLMGIVVLDIILSQNRRHRRHYPPSDYRPDDSYKPPYHTPRYTNEPSHFEHYPPYYRRDSTDYWHNQREHSPVVATMVFMIVLIALLYFLAH
jgi:cbb3-type cytochrome oxidase subunit 3